MSYGPGTHLAHFPRVDKILKPRVSTRGAFLTRAAKTLCLHGQVVCDLGREGRRLTCYGYVRTAEGEGVLARRQRDQRPVPVCREWTVLSWRTLKAFFVSGCKGRFCLNPAETILRGAVDHKLEIGEVVREVLRACTTLFRGAAVFADR